MNDIFKGILNSITSSAIAVLSGLGIGSGGLLVIWLTAIGVDAQSARAINLLFFVFSASASFALHYVKGRINLSYVTLMSLAACIGTVVGFFAGNALDPYTLRKVFGIMLIVSGSYTLLGVIKATRRQTKQKNRYFFKKRKKISKNPLQNEKYML